MASRKIRATSLPRIPRLALSRLDEEDERMRAISTPQRATTSNPKPSRPSNPASSSITEELAQLESEQPRLASEAVRAKPRLDNGRDDQCSTSSELTCLMATVAELAASISHDREVNSRRFAQLIGKGQNKLGEYESLENATRGLDMDQSPLSDPALVQHETASFLQYRAKNKERECVDQ